MKSGECFLVGACALAVTWQAFAQAAGPVEAAIKFYDAAQASRCQDVWALYSRAMQKNAGAPEYRCWKDRDHARVDVRLDGMQGDSATVAVILRGMIPRGRWEAPGEMTQWTEEVKLVREAGAWKVDGPRREEERKPGRLLDPAEARVTITPYPEAGRHQVLEASAASWLPRDDLDAALVGAQAWARALPSFAAIESIETGKVGRARLSFAESAAPIAITMRIAGRPNNAKAGFTSITWAVEQEMKAPVYMRGEWHLAPDNNGTTRIKLTVVIDPRHWPGSERLFSAQRMAQALVELERTAAKAVPAVGTMALDASPQPAAPVEAAVRYIDAGIKSRCTEVWERYSGGTQEYLRMRARRQERERAGLPTGEKPEETGCGRAGKLKRGSARLVRLDRDEAMVHAVILDRVPRHRHDMFPPEVELPQVIRMVRERGDWKVELKREYAPSTHRELAEVGDVDVFFDSRVPAGLQGRYEASAVIRAPRTAFEKLLRDPSAWAVVLPSFKAIEALEPVGDRARVRLSLQDPAPPVVYFLSMSPPPPDPRAGNTTLQWNPETGFKAPYLRGRWDIEPNADGSTRVKLSFVMDPGHWPEGHFTPEKLGNAVRDLGKAAMQVR